MTCSDHSQDDCPTVTPYAAKIHRLRMAREMDLEDLARRTGIAEHWLKSIEGGASCFLHDIVKIAAELHVLAEELYNSGGKHEVVPPKSDYIRSVRKERDLSRAELAKESGVSARTIYSMESGHEVSIASLDAVAAVLDRPVHHLFVSADNQQQDYQHDFLFEQKRQIGRVHKTANGLLFHIFRVDSRNTPGHAYRAKRYDLASLSKDDREKIEVCLSRHKDICVRIRDCPHIARHATTIQNGQHYWVMDDWVEGRTLAEMVEKNTAMEQLPRIMKEILIALRAMHAEDIVRRELTPASVLIESKDSQVVLTEFELAKILAAPTTVAPMQWKKPNPYRAPEFEVPGADVSASADFYSWAVMLAHALAGTRKCPANVSGVLEEADIPSRLKKAALACLLPADDRPQTARSLLAAIKAWR